MVRTTEHLLPAKAGAFALDPNARQRLALSESAFPPSPAAVAAAGDELSRLRLYPNSDGEPLRSAIAEFHGVDSDAVVVGNGADELLLLVALATGAPGATGVVTARTFAGHAAALELAGCDVYEAATDQSGHDAADLLDAVGHAQTSIVCNPHNPTGLEMRAGEMADLVEAADQAGGHLIVDEAYIEFADPAVCPSVLPLVLRGRPVVVIRSFSKAYGLAGLRCGYAVGPAPLMRLVAQIAATLPFSTNRVALSAARAALGDQNYLAQVVAATRRSRSTMRQLLAEHGIRTTDSQTNFILAKLGAGASAVVARLASEHSTWIRDAGPMGYPGWVRIGVCHLDEAPRIVARIVELCNERRPPDRGLESIGSAR